MTRRALLVALLASLGVLVGRSLPTTEPSADAEYLRQLRAVVQPVPGGLRLGGRVRR